MLVLKLLTETELTTYDGRLFHKLITLWVKEYFRSSVLRSVRRTELKEPEITKNSKAIWSAGSAIALTATSSEVEMVNRFISSKLTNIRTFNYELMISKDSTPFYTGAGRWDEI